MIGTISVDSFGSSNKELLICKTFAAVGTRALGFAVNQTHGSLQNSDVEFQLCLNDDTQRFTLVLYNAANGVEMQERLYPAKSARLEGYAKHSVAFDFFDNYFLQIRDVTYDRSIKDRRYRFTLWHAYDDSLHYLFWVRYADSYNWGTYYMNGFYDNGMAWDHAIGAWRP